MAQYDISSQFFNWFKNLDGSRRINVACQIFASCHPTELRFFATYISDLFILENNRMNDVDSNVYNILNSFVDFDDRHIRCELIMAVSLLHQRNYEVSSAIYVALSEYMRIGWIKDALFSEVSTANQIELLLTLVSNHPAFTFSQKVFFDEQTEYFKTKRNEYLMKQKVEHGNKQIRCFKHGAVGSVNAHFPQDEFTISTVERQPDISERSANVNCHRSNDGGRIKNIKVAGAYLKRMYKIEVSFPSGKRSHIERSSNDIVNYHHWLSEHLEQKLCLPDLPDLEIDATSTEVSLDQIQNLQDYFRKFIKCVPSYMVHDDIALDFFQTENFVRPSHEVLDHPISAGEKAFPDFKQVFKQRNDEKECPVSFRCSEFPASYSPKAKSNTLPRKPKLTFYPPISSSSSEETLRKQAPSDCSSCSNSSTGSTEQIKSDYLPKSSAETNGKRYEPNPLTANSVLEAEKKIKNLKVSSQSSSERPKSGRKHKREYKKIYLQF